MGPVGRDWEFRLCPESNGESGVLIDRSDIIRIALKKNNSFCCCVKKELKGQTGDRKARQEAIKVWGWGVMWGPGLGLGLELWRLREVG